MPLGCLVLAGTSSPLACACLHKCSNFTMITKLSITGIERQSVEVRRAEWHASAVSCTDSGGIPDCCSSQRHHQPPQWASPLFLQLISLRQTNSYRHTLSDCSRPSASLATWQLSNLQFANTQTLRLKSSLIYEPLMVRVCG